METTTSQRKDLVTARGSLRRAALGEGDVDFDTAASLLDRVLATTCPHQPDQHHTSTDVKTGRPLTVCYECGVTWYADFAQRLPEQVR